VPLWSMITVHVYRIDGLSILVPLWEGDKIPKFVGYQTLVLDVIIGTIAIPLSFLLYKYEIRILLRHKLLKDILWLWNSLGLYDLCSGYVLLLLNYLSIGPASIIEPSNFLQILQRHPFILLISFQVPLAIIIHCLLLVKIDDIIEEQSNPQLPHHVRKIRQKQQQATS
jgi:hypothetical protein